MKGFPDFILCLQQRLVGLNIVRGAKKFLAATSMPMRLNSRTTQKRVKPAHGLKIVWNREKDAAPNEPVTNESFPRLLGAWPKNDNMPTLELRIRPGLAHTREESDEDNDDHHHEDEKAQGRQQSFMKLAEACTPPPAHEQGRRFTPPPTPPAPHAHQRNPTLEGEAVEDAPQVVVADDSDDEGDGDAAATRSGRRASIYYDADDGTR